MAMYFYLLPKTGTGTNEDSFRPNVPDGIPYVSGDYYDQVLVGSSAPLAGQTELTQDEAINLAYTAHLDISKWAIG